MWNAVFNINWQASENTLASSTESEVNLCVEKMWTAIDKLLIIWKSNLSNEIKLDFFQTVSVSVLLFGCTTWTLIKHLEKKLYGS